MVVFSAGAVDGTLCNHGSDVISINIYLIYYRIYLIYLENVIFFSHFAAGQKCMFQIYSIKTAAANTNI